VNISKNEYQEYSDWKRKKEIEISLQETINLEDDIDFPIRNSVAILALAGCSVMFSCCGFDYHGQPAHKAHQYGEPYIMMRDDAETQRVLGSVYTRLSYGWKLDRRQGLIFLELVHINNPHWTDPTVVHFSENLVIAINDLEKYLFKNLGDMLQEEVILEDTNKNHYKNLKYWQYPPKNPWAITLDSLTV
jgi:hypothetical protein